MQSLLSTGSHEAAQIVAAIVRADYANNMRKAHAQARVTLQLEFARDFTAAEVDEFLRSGSLPSGVKVPR